MGFWLDPKMVPVQPPTGRQGRKPQLSDAERRAFATMKFPFGKSFRQTTDFVEGQLLPGGFDGSVPDFRMLNRLEKAMAAPLYHRGCQEQLNVLIVSKGMKAENKGERRARKQYGATPQLWRKIHIGVDEQTLEIRAIETAGNNVGDVPILPELLAQSPASEEVGKFASDGAYDTRKCNDAFADRAAHAVIPLRRNTNPWRPSKAGAIAQNEALRASKYLGGKIWPRRSGYHRRSRDGTKMRSVKLLGRSPIALDFDRQNAELQIRAAVVKAYTALGIAVTQLMG